MKFLLLVHCFLLKLSLLRTEQHPGLLHFHLRMLQLLFPLLLIPVMWGQSLRPMMRIQQQGPLKVQTVFKCMFLTDTDNFNCVLIIHLFDQIWLSEKVMFKWMGHQSIVLHYFHGSTTYVIFGTYTLQLYHSQTLEDQSVGHVYCEGGDSMFWFVANRIRNRCLSDQITNFLQHSFCETVPLCSVVFPPVQFVHEVWSVRLFQDPIGHFSQRSLLAGFRKWPTGQTGIELNWIELKPLTFMIHDQLFVEISQKFKTEILILVLSSISKRTAVILWGCTIVLCRSSLQTLCTRSLVGQIVPRANWTLVAKTIFWIEEVTGRTD